MLLMNEEETKTVKKETVTGPEPEELDQEELIQVLQKENQELAHQLADTRYKLNQTEIECKRLDRVIKSCIETRNWTKSEYLELLDKILDRVNRGCSDD